LKTIDSKSQRKQKLAISPLEDWKMLMLELISISFPVTMDFSIDIQDVPETCLRVTGN
jgi:hypothetical protein